MNEDGDGSYDPNRDWPWNWQPKHVQNGAHRYPFSLPENRAVGDFLKTRDNIAGAQSYHNTGGMIFAGRVRKTIATTRPI
ncbi:MAG: M14 family zinc carboxypeptidase [Pirellulales bacterium]